MTALFEEPDHATPLAPDERLGLIPSHIAYRHELNAAEQENIVRAQDWALGRRRNLLSEGFIKELHRRMFEDVWRWAGNFRKTERNIGIPFYQIPIALREILEDTKTWIEHSTYHRDELAVRFHHRLVYIHPFPNGNGRHARLMADLLVMRLGAARFTWGSASLRETTSLREATCLRRRYIAALQDADNHDYSALLTFSRS